MSFPDQLRPLGQQFCTCSYSAPAKAWRFDPNCANASETFLNETYCVEITKDGDMIEPRQVFAKTPGHCAPARFPFPKDKAIRAFSKAKRRYMLDAGVTVELYRVTPQLILCAESRYGQVNVMPLPMRRNPRLTPNTAMPSQYLLLQQLPGEPWQVIFHDSDKQTREVMFSGGRREARRFWRDIRLSIGWENVPAIVDESQGI